MLKIIKVSKKYKTGKSDYINALKNISLNIGEGEFVGIMGRSGSGKSTLLNIIGCLDKPDTGSVLLNNQEIHNKNDKERTIIRNQNIGFIFQEFNLIPIFTVYENIELPFLISKNKYYKSRKKKILNLIEKVGLSQYIHHRANQLSGGQMQRVAIARSLVMSPQIVLADELTANIDTENSNLIMKILKRINKNRQTTFIICTHDPLIVKYMDRIIRIEDGEINKINISS